MSADDMEFPIIVFVPYNLTGAPMWGFASSDLGLVREYIRKYQGKIEFGGIYEFDCKEVMTHAIRGA